MLDYDIYKAFIMCIAERLYKAVYWLLIWELKCYGVMAKMAL